MIYVMAACALIAGFVLIALPIGITLLILEEWITKRGEEGENMAMTCIYGGRECDGCAYCNKADDDYKLDDDEMPEDDIFALRSPTPKKGKEKAAVAPATQKSADISAHQYKDSIA